MFDYVPNGWRTTEYVTDDDLTEIVELELQTLLDIYDPQDEFIKAEEMEL